MTTSRQIAQAANEMLGWLTQRAMARQMGELPAAGQGDRGKEAGDEMRRRFPDFSHKDRMRVIRAMERNLKSTAEKHGFKIPAPDAAVRYLWEQ